MIKHIKTTRKKKYKARISRKRSVQHGGVVEVICKNVLGEGAYGIVFLGERETGPLGAVKFLKNKPVSNVEYSRQIQVHRTEQDIYKLIKDLDCVNLLKSIDLPEVKITVKGDYNINKSVPALITELCDFDLHSLITGAVLVEDMNIYGTTHKFLTKSYGIPDKTVIYYIASQIFDGLLALYNNQIIHCDIKPENIFVKRELDGKYIFKIGDFGFATKHSDLPLAKTYNDRHSKNTYQQYQKKTYYYAIHSDLHTYNTYMKDLTAYALTLYVLENRNLCNINAENMEISKLSKPGNTIHAIISILNQLESKMLALPTLHNNYEKDTEMYKKTYEALSKLFEDWKEKQVGNINNEVPIPIIPKIISHSKNNNSLILKNKYVNEENIKNIFNDISNHYSLTLQQTESYIKDGQSDWSLEFLGMCEDRA